MQPLERPEDVTVDERHCTRCDTVKPWYAFSKNKHHTSGLQSWCKACHTASEQVRIARKQALREQAKEPTVDKTVKVKQHERAVVKAKKAGPPSLPREVFSVLFGSEAVQAPAPEVHVNGKAERYALARDIIALHGEILKELIR